jgi:hypothetical protein
MKTATNPVIQIYKEINVGKHTTVSHYELIETNFKPLLSKLLHISNDRKCAKSSPVYWLRERRGNKWSPCLTGLFKTDSINIYKGDLEKKKHLIIFKFSEDNSLLTLYIFKNFYTRNLSTIKRFLDR